MDILNRVIVFALILILFWVLYRFQDKIFSYVSPQNTPEKPIENKPVHATQQPINQINQDKEDTPPPLLPTTNKRVTFSDQMDTDSFGSMSGSMGSSDLGSLLSDESF